MTSPTRDTPDWCYRLLEPTWLSGRCPPRRGGARRGSTSLFPLLLLPLPRPGPQLLASPSILLLRRALAPPLLLRTRLHLLMPRRLAALFLSMLRVPSCVRRRRLAPRPCPCLLLRATTRSFSLRSSISTSSPATRSVGVPPLAFYAWLLTWHMTIFSLSPLRMVWPTCSTPAALAPSSVAVVSSRPAPITEAPRCAPSFRSLGDRR